MKNDTGKAEWVARRNYLCAIKIQINEIIAIPILFMI